MKQNLRVEIPCGFVESMRKSLQDNDVVELMNQWGANRYRISYTEFRRCVPLR